MWVEAEPASFEVGERIAVRYRNDVDLVPGTTDAVHNGTFGMTYFTDDSGRARAARHSRTFYKWVEDKLDQSRLRLNQPGVVQQKTTRCDVQVGHQTYVLEPGDHLRVWWEDGALWSELVQERTK